MRCVCVFVCVLVLVFWVFCGVASLSVLCRREDQVYGVSPDVRPPSGAGTAKRGKKSGMRAKKRSSTNVSSRTAVSRTMSQTTMSREEQLLAHASVFDAPPAASASGSRLSSTARQQFYSDDAEDLSAALVDKQVRERVSE